MLSVDNTLMEDPFGIWEAAPSERPVRQQVAVDNRDLSQRSACGLPIRDSLTERPRRLAGLSTWRAAAVHDFEQLAAPNPRQDVRVENLTQVSESGSLNTTARHA